MRTLARSTRPRASVIIFFTCGLWLVVLGLYFALVRPPLLPEDLRYIGGSVGLERVPSQGLERWLHRVFIVMGGFIAASGVLTAFLAVSAVAERRTRTGVALCIVGLATVATMSWTNFAIDSDFKWLLFVPTVLWGAGIAAYGFEGRPPRTSKRLGTAAPSHPHPVSEERGPPTRMSRDISAR